MKFLRRLFCRAFGHNEDMFEPRCNFCGDVLDVEVIRTRDIAWDALMNSSAVRLIETPPLPSAGWHREAIYTSI